MPGPACPGILLELRAPRQLAVIKSHLREELADETRNRINSLIWSRRVRNNDAEEEEIYKELKKTTVIEEKITEEEKQELISNIKNGIANSLKERERSKLERARG